MDNNKNILDLFDALPEVSTTGNWEQSLFSKLDNQLHEQRMAQSGKLLMAVTVVLLIVNLFTLVSLNNGRSNLADAAGKSDWELVADNLLITGNR